MNALAQINRHSRLKSQSTASFLRLSERHVCLWTELALLAISAFGPQFAQAGIAEAWVQRYDGPWRRTDAGVAVAVDDSGNVAVTGYSETNPDYMGGHTDFYTAKYARTNGTLLWERRHSAGRSDIPKSMAVDTSGNVVVTGVSYNARNSDYYTAKYAAADGALLWEKRYDGPPNSGDVPNALAVDGSGNVVVTGYSYAIGNGDITDIYTAKYAAADGALLWEKRYNGPLNNFDAAIAVAVDGSGNVVVGGYSVESATASARYTAKYAAVDGTLIWEKRSGGPTNGLNQVRAVAVDKNGDVVVTGSSGFSGLEDRSDFYTAKYAANDGALLWERRYNGPASRGDHANAIAVDGMCNVIVTGSSDNETNRDFYTAKYAATDGTLLWERRYHGPGNNDGYDYAKGVVADEQANVIITGSSLNRDGISDYYTAKYAAADGALIWEKRYNGPGNGWDSIGGGNPCLALGPDGMVVVTGSSGGEFGYDFATVVYRENPPPVIICPPNISMNATGNAGIIITFTVTATDDSGIPRIVCVPPSGSVFPVGQSPVTCTATDSDAETNICSFTVTVLSARDIKEKLLAELIALRATFTDRNDRRQLDAAIRHLIASLAPELWADEMHLNRNRGGTVFHEEKLAGIQLCHLLRRHIPLPFVPHNFLTQADSLLAVVAIEDAIAASASSKKIAQAQRFLARGDAEAVDTKCHNGIEEYRKAWSHVTR